MGQPLTEEELAADDAAAYLLGHPDVCYHWSMGRIAGTRLYKTACGLVVGMIHTAFAPTRDLPALMARIPCSLCAQVQHEHELFNGGHEEVSW